MLTPPWKDNIVYDGLEVDQTNFKKLIQHTKYGRTALFYDGNYCILQDEEIIDI